MHYSFFTLFFICLAAVMIIFGYRLIELYRGRPFESLERFRGFTEPRLRRFYIQAVGIFFTFHSTLAAVVRDRLWWPAVRLTRKLLHRGGDFLTAILDYLYRRFIHWRYSRLRKKKERKKVE